MTEQKMQCMVQQCKEESEVYCSTCKQLFCGKHNEIHKTFISIVLTPHLLLTSEEYVAGLEENCGLHDNSPVVMGCIRCYKTMCPTCHDEETSKQCPADGQDKHMARSIEAVARQVKDDLHELLNDLRAKELVAADEIKMTQLQYDEETEENRSDLEKLELKIQELHTLIDDFSKETREKIVSHLNEKKSLMKQCESTFAEYQKQCKTAHDKTAQFLHRKNVMIVKDFQKMKDELSQANTIEHGLQTVKFPPNISIVVEDASFHVPIILKESDTKLEIIGAAIEAQKDESEDKSDDESDDESDDDMGFAL